MDIALNRQEQIITYQGKAYNMIGKGIADCYGYSICRDIILFPITFIGFQSRRFRPNLLYAKVEW